MSKVAARKSVGWIPLILYANTEPMLLIASEYAFHKTLKPVTIIDSV